MPILKGVQVACHFDSRIVERFFEKYPGFERCVDRLSSAAPDGCRLKGTVRPCAWTYLYDSSCMIVARRYLVRGRVQGVGFRYFAEDQARLEGVGGYVRNLPDGCVEALAEGDVEAVTRFERAIRHGPPGARVEDVETESLQPLGLQTFLIKS